MQTSLIFKKEEIKSTEKAVFLKCYVIQHMTNTCLYKETENLWIPKSAIVEEKAWKISHLDMSKGEENEEEVTMLKVKKWALKGK